MWKKSPHPIRITPPPPLVFPPFPTAVPPGTNAVLSNSPVIHNLTNPVGSCGKPNILYNSRKLPNKPPKTDFPKHAIRQTGYFPPDNPPGNPKPSPHHPPYFLYNIHNPMGTNLAADQPLSPTKPGYPQLCSLYCYYFYYLFKYTIYSISISISRKSSRPECRKSCKIAEQ